MKSPVAVISSLIVVVAMGIGVALSVGAYKNKLVPASVNPCDENASVAVRDTANSSWPIKNKAKPCGRYTQGDKDTKPLR